MMVDWRLGKLQFFTILFITLLGFGFAQEEKTVIYLIGDSTCADKNPEAFPEMGWGTPFKTFFNASVHIENRAKNGRSTKSFLEEGRWDDVLSTLKKDDYVFIQFGHNDEVKSKVGRYTTPEEFKTNLKKYVKDSQEKKANPILLTPVSRRSFENGELTDTHQQYAQLVREVAQEEQVPLIDMTRKSMDLLEKWGVQKSELLFHHLSPGEHPNYPNGRKDNTHFNELGARKMAQLVLQGVRELKIPLEDQILKR
ncbi:rhamnogalacturonan acetylesterase [Flexithrix dorotheae]|uniref:rhamnogalacturonan acetylesterase n=1 Tax=Flexithrix dorotheae TaxID=70993 RepID=UPI00038144E4|nr:rhamnogalacturonan acetylesterase [Flexithrix dorotheae]